MGGGIINAMAALSYDGHVTTGHGWKISRYFSKISDIFYIFDIYRIFSFCSIGLGDVN